MQLIPAIEQSCNVFFYTMGSRLGPERITRWYRDFGYLKIVEERNSNELADVLVKEIEHGVSDTKIRAGFIGEIGTGRHFIKSAEERVFRAAALAQRRTGVAITTHTTRWATILAASVLSSVVMLSRK